MNKNVIYIGLVDGITFCTFFFSCLAFGLHIPDLTFSHVNLFIFIFLECQNAFSLVVRPPTEQENLLFSFQLTAEDTLKSAWLKTLCRQVANTICRADAVSGHTCAHT